MLASNSTPMTAWDRIGLIALIVAVIALCGITVKRSALSATRRGDFGVYARAAWAVRTGANLREVTCVHGWHYVYPATLAVLMVPLADPPLNQVDHRIYLPLAASVAFWFLANVGFLVLAVHLLASALEKTVGRGASKDCRFDRPWWRIRVFPIVACLPVVGETLTRGQVNFIVLAGICGFIAALVHGRTFRAGAWLAGAICIKIIPAFLLIVPLLRRDVRCLGGCAAALIVLALAIPVAGLGVSGTIEDYRQFGQTVLGPGLGLGQGEHSRVDDELTNITCGHSQSFMGVVHTWMHPNRVIRPEQIPSWTRRLHWALGGGMLLLTLLAGSDLWRPRSAALVTPHASAMAGQSTCKVPKSIRLTLFVGLLVINMLMLSPMCHSHYLCLAIPAFMALMAVAWQGRSDDWLGRELTALMGLFIVAMAVPMLPGLILLDDGGVSGMAVLLVWFAGARELWKSRPATKSGELPEAAAGNYHTTGLRKLSPPAPHHRVRQASPSTSFKTSSET